MAAVKALQQWCRLQCEGYRDVSITNMTTSFRDGLAFCALIHRHRPDLINFDSLKKDDVYENNKLAFSVAEQQLGIPALLDAEDMVALRVPDRLSILTYVSQYYNYFHGRSPIGGMAGVKRPAEGVTELQPAGKKNAPVSAKVFPSSGPTKENLPPADHSRPAPVSTPRQKQDVPAQRPLQTGTLSNKCVSCNKHVHLVQRHLVDGKLYHRNCAKTLTGNPFTADLSKNNSLSRLAPDPGSEKTTSPAAPSWLSHKPTTPSSVSSGTSHPQPPSTSPSISPSPPRTSASSKTNVTSISSSPRPASSTKTSLTTIMTTPSSINVSKSGSKFEPTTTTSSSTPTPTPRTSIASKNLQAKMKFFQANDGDSGGTKATEMFRGQKEEVPASHSVTVLVQVGAKERQKEKEKEEKAIEKERQKEKEEKAIEKERQKVKEEKAIEKERQKEKEEKAIEKERQKEKQREKEREREKEKEKRDKEQSQSKASAAAFISKKLTEENNNKPDWSVNQTHKHTPAEVPEKEMGRGRVRLRANPSLLSDLTIPSSEEKRSLSPKNNTKDKPSHSPLSSPGPPKPQRTSLYPSGSQNESPSDWRARLKPVSPDPSPKSSSQAQSKPWTNGSNVSQSVGPSRPAPPTPRISVTPSSQEGYSTPPRESTAEKEASNKKTKADYIPQDEILKELQQIEDSLNELERTGVELEHKLRTSEEDGEDESVMNELMVEWFTLIRNKQVAMRRESELVYIGRTQELEEEQPTVEQELRRLLDKPEHLKTPWERRREETLMKKLVEIVNDRNAIVEGLDEDRLREEEEDEQLNQLMSNFNLKKEKSKKKSPMSRLFSWSSKDS